MKLQLTHNGEPVSVLLSGGWLHLPDGRAISPAVAGWSSADGYALAEYVEPPADPEFPKLSPRQIRLALLSIGITEAHVDAALVGDEAGMIEWKYATTFERHHVLVESLSEVMELPPEQVDTLWIWASGL